MRVKDFTMPLQSQQKRIDFFLLAKCRQNSANVTKHNNKCSVVWREQSSHFKFIPMGAELLAHTVNCGIDSWSEKKSGREHPKVE